jgi:hypothetical protein
MQPLCAVPGVGRGGQAALEFDPDRIGLSEKEKALFSYA